MILHGWGEIQRSHMQSWLTHSRGIHLWNLRVLQHDWWTFVLWLLHSWTSGWFSEAWDSSRRKGQGPFLRGCFKTPADSMAFLMRLRWSHFLGMLLEWPTPSAFGWLETYLRRNIRVHMCFSFSLGVSFLPPLSHEKVGEECALFIWKDSQFFFFNRK